MCNRGIGDIELIVTVYALGFKYCLFKILILTHECSLKLVTFFRSPDIEYAQILNQFFSLTWKIALIFDNGERGKGDGGGGGLNTHN